MPQLTIDPTGRTVVRDGAPLPIVADTAWSAFSDPTPEEWRHYVRQRRQQGFTAIAISVLPILNDRTVWSGSRNPYAVDADGRFDYTRVDESYWAVAREQVRAVADEGLVPMLVVLWCCYVEGTWAAERLGWGPLPEAERRAHVSRVAATFAEFDPILVVSGDDNFVHEHSADVYGEALAQLAVEAPHCLTTLHSSPTAVLPPALADSPDLDLYVYQSGHAEDEQHLCHELAAQYLASPVRRPIVNLEPAYEQHGYGHTGAGRFSRAQVRRAIWWSILGGASAGAGYGAHGVWQWHRREGEFTSPGFSLEPLPWQVALALPGGDDVTLTASLLADHGLHRLEPAQERLVGSPAPGARAAASPDGDLVALYLPFAREHELRIGGALADFAVRGWDLDARTPVVPRVEAGVTEGVVVLRQLDLLGDALIVFERRAAVAGGQ